MKYKTKLYLVLNSGGWMHKIFKKWAINIQHIEISYEISFFFLNNVDE